MKRTNTKALAIVTAMNNLISANKASFKAGSTMSAKDFLSLAAQISGLNAPAYSANPSNVSKYNLQIVGAYTKFNKLLAARGLVIKAKDYYSSFTIVDSSRVTAEVERISARAASCAVASTNLQTGYSLYAAKFSKLKPTELVRVSSYITRGF